MTAYYVQINDGYTKTIGASTRSALLDAVAEYHNLSWDEITVRELEDGSEMISFLQGPDIGLIARSKHPHTYSMQLAAE